MLIRLRFRCVLSLPSVLLLVSFGYGRFGIPAERIWISVFEEDDEAVAIWRDEVRGRGMDDVRGRKRRRDE